MNPVFSQTGPAIPKRLNPAPVSNSQVNAGSVPPGSRNMVPASTSGQGTVVNAVPPANTATNMVANTATNTNSATNANVATASAPINLPTQRNRVNPLRSDEIQQVGLVQQNNTNKQQSPPALKKPPKPVLQAGGTGSRSGQITRVSQNTEQTNEQAASELPNAQAADSSPNTNSGMEQELGLTNLLSASDTNVQSNPNAQPNTNALPELNVPVSNNNPYATSSGTVQNSNQNTLPGNNINEASNIDPNHVQNTTNLDSVTQQPALDEFAQQKPQNIANARQADSIPVQPADPYASNHFQPENIVAEQNAQSGVLNPTITPQNASPLAGEVDESAVVRPSVQPSAQYPPQYPPQVAATPKKSGYTRTQPKVAGIDRSDNVAPPRREQRSVEGTGMPGAKELEGPQSPILVLEKIAPKEVQVGQPVVLKTVLSNNGTNPAKEIIIRDRIPQGARLVSTNPAATILEGGELVWTLGDLAPKESLNVEMEVVPQHEGEIGSVATVQFSTAVSGKTVATQAMLELEMTAPPAIHIGQNVTFDLVLSNPGSGTAQNVVLALNVPDGLVHEKGKELEFTVGNIAPKETKKLPLSMRCTAPGKITSTIKAKADNKLESIAQVSFEVQAPDLKLEIAGPKQRYLERKASYTLTVSNPGSATATGVDLIAKLPNGLKFVSTNQNGIYDAQTHSVHWALVELPAKEAGEIELVTLPVTQGDHSIVFNGSGEAGLKASTTHEVSITGLPSLSFEVLCLSGPVEQGKTAKYEVKLSNRGTKASRNIAVSVRLLEGMQFSAAEGPTNYQVNSGVIQFAPLTSLDPKQEKTYTFTAKCLSTGDKRVVVSILSDELQRPITKEESTQVFEDH